MQDILYLHTRVNSLTSDILAMRIVKYGQISALPKMELLEHRITNNGWAY